MSMAVSSERNDIILRSFEAHIPPTVIWRHISAYTTVFRIPLRKLEETKSRQELKGQWKTIYNLTI